MTRKREASPICLVKDDDLVPPRWQGHFLLRKHLDFVAHDVDPSVIRFVKFDGVSGRPSSMALLVRSPVIRSVELQYCLAIVGPEELMR